MENIKFQLIINPNLVFWNLTTLEFHYQTSKGNLIRRKTPAIREHICKQIRRAVDLMK